MGREASHAQLIAREPLRYLRELVASLGENRILLLAGAVAYYTLLSLLPLLILLVVVLSHWLPEEQLLATLGRYLDLVAPGHAAPLLEELAKLLHRREATGGIMLATLLFSSSLAFSVLERSMAVIFRHRVRVHARRWLASTLIPYAYILLLGAGLLLVTLAAGSLEALGTRRMAIFGFERSLGPMAAALLYLIGLGGEILLLTSIYIVMPAGRLAWRHALVGGIAAGLLWEVTRRILAWFFATLSRVSLLYGSFATVISLLLSFELAAIVLLFGAQVISIYERPPTSDSVPGTGDTVS
ncbi:MAG: YihY/virulence factor BrkB family protein [Burkholderiales bacterium]|nr:YihY/virulence factor BrkB family protein [Burkholderiales bacterium]